MPQRPLIRDLRPPSVAGDARPDGRIAVAIIEPGAGVSCRTGSGANLITLR